MFCSRLYPTLFTKVLFYSTLFVISLTSVACNQPAPDRPNIVWITAEDMSPVIRYLGDNYAITPNLDRLASESVIYTHAFATSPVCSPSRSALINGMMATEQGTHQMRSTYALPPDWLGFPAALRNAGYYTTNNVKTDYNTGHAGAIIEASFNENSDTAGWRGRDEGQPFFSIFNHMVSHQSRTMTWPYEQFQKDVQSQLSPAEIHDPATAPIPPYYPDTPLIRKTIARFYDSITVLDKQVGQILDDLEQDGLLENTIIFFYSDHGSGMPRHKRAILDSGMHVPLFVRFPEKYQHLAPTSAGGQFNRIVNFEDFGPTVLSLAGVDIPAYMQGQPFLGDATTKARKYTFGHRDRIDETMDMSRSVRDDRYHYVRHYMPHLGYNQQSAWPDQGDILHEFYNYDLSKMTPAQRHFAGPTRPLEELFDSETDPLHLNNLVDSEGHQDVLQRMRDVLHADLVERVDLGFIPELEMVKQSGDQPSHTWARSGAFDLEAHMEAADVVGTDNFAAFRQNLQSPLAGVRYWGAMGYTAAQSISGEDISLLKEALSDNSEAVQIEAATALLNHGYANEALAKLIQLLTHENEVVILHAARAIELGGEKSMPAYDAMKALNEKYAQVTVDPGWFIYFSTTGFLNRVNR